MKLSSLLKDIKIVSVYDPDAVNEKEKTDLKSGDPLPLYAKKHPIFKDVEIGSIHYRARDVKPGGLFAAVPGLVTDGHLFVDEAIYKGAVAVITQKPMKKAAIIIEVQNSRKAMAAISARFFSNPSHNLKIIGITGTNGKTTTALLIEHLLLKAGFKTGVIGTLNYRYSGKTFKNPVTTPESMDLQRILADMVKEGITHVVMEVSSHALDLYRVYKCRIDTGVFTNLTQDHLDYHKDMESYWACKKRMFTKIMGSGNKTGDFTAIINANDEKGRELIRLIRSNFPDASVISTGFSEKNRLRSLEFNYGLTGIKGKIETGSQSFDFHSPLTGKHNLENILCAAGAGIALNLSPEVIRKGIESVLTVPGRLEPVPNDDGKFIYVDYAHTPDALENVLGALKASAAGRIICVFGCGGNRDRKKRPQMGRIGVELSDLAIITSDNPRNEPPDTIIADIVSGIKNKDVKKYRPKDLEKGVFQKGYVIEPDRKAAIALGIKISRPKDIILIAGKGNETCQIIGNKTFPFDDRKVAKHAVDVQYENPGNNTGSGKVLPWTAAQVLAATDGALLRGEPGARFAGVCIDSRTIHKKELFVAIEGENYDGHNFVSEVINKGARGLLINRDRAGELTLPTSEEKKMVCITVKDTKKALGDLGGFNRRRCDIAVIAITGSNGKTSTRKMTEKIIARRYCTLSTTGNMNNEIGLPLTLLRLTGNHRVGVLELGMNHPGEIMRLGQICSPDIGVITNTGPAHLEGLGSMDAVIKAKGELLGNIRPAGTAIINADDPGLTKTAKNFSGNLLFFGLSKKSSVSAESIKREDDRISFVLILPSGKISVRIKTPADFMVSNALAAAAAGYVAGLTADEIKAGLDEFKPAYGRMNIHKTGKGINIVDDTYNANPASMSAAIKTLVSLKKKNRGVLVAGDMLELGEYAESMHREIGRIAAGSGIERIYITGDHQDAVAAGALDENMNSGNVITGSKKEILENLVNWLNTDDWVLVKGSRGMAMETIVRGLIDWGNG